jgi:hypothetical protein
MKKPILYACLSFALALTGCGKDKKDTASVNANGTCTGAYVDDFRELYHAFEARKRLSRTASHAVFKSTLQRNEVACQTFLSRHGSAPACIVPVDGLRYLSVPEGIRTECETVSQEMRKIREYEAGRNPPQQSAPRPESPENPIPGVPDHIDDGKTLSTLDAARLKIRVLDESKIRTVWESSPTIYLVGGDLVERAQFQSRIQEMQSVPAICYAVTSSDQAFAEGHVLSLSRQLEDTKNYQGRPNRRWTGVVDEETTLFCFNLTNRAFKLGDIRNAYRGVLEITLED